MNNAPFALGFQSTAMSARIILTSDGESAKFGDRVLELANTFKVTRATREEEPATNNAVFQCKVLSKNHAVLSFRDGEFFLKDNGSSNGSFINNFRLCKPGQESEDQKLFTKDVIRFGSQVHDKEKMVKERCIIAKICLFLPDGSEHSERPSSDRLFRPLQDLKQPQRKTVSFASQEDLVDRSGSHDEKELSGMEKNIVEKALQEHQEQEEAQRMMKNKVDNLEKKLKRKQNEASNLVELINKIKENEDTMTLEISDLKEKLKERDKEKNNENEMKEEIQILKQQLEKRESENEDDSLQMENGILKRKLEEYEDMYANEVTMKLEIETLERKLHEKDREYTTLEFLMTEETETVNKIEVEMRRLLGIISEYHEALASKDEMIVKLQESTELAESEILHVKNELQTVIDDSESTIFSLKLKIEEQENLLNEQVQMEEFQDKLQNQQLLEFENETLKLRLDALENTINEKDIEIETVQSHLLSQEQISKQKIQIQKELLSLQSAINDKDFKINFLQEAAERQAEIISKNDSLIVNYTSEIKSMKSQLEAKQMQPQINAATLEEKEALICSLEENLIKEQDKNNNIEADLEEKNCLLTSLKEKVMKEQDINKEVEDELIKLKIEYDNLKLEKVNDNLKPQKNSDPEETSINNIPMTEHIQLLNLKNEEINELKLEIAREQQIVAHVQMVQEGEIVEKEKELVALRDEIIKLKHSSLQVNGIPEETQVKPDVIKYGLNSFVEEAIESDDDTETVTFHDALSDDEDVLIDDLDLDEDWVNVQHNKQNSDSDLGDLSLG